MTFYEKCFNTYAMPSGTEMTCDLPQITWLLHRTFRVLVRMLTIEMPLTPSSGSTVIPVTFLSVISTRVTRKTLFRQSRLKDVGKSLAFHLRLSSFSKYGPQQFEIPNSCRSNDVYRGGSEQMASPSPSC